jgi:hypothetical protein
MLYLSLFLRIAFLIGRGFEFSLAKRHHLLSLMKVDVLLVLPELFGIACEFGVGRPTLVPFSPSIFIDFIDTMALLTPV